MVLTSFGDYEYALAVEIARVLGDAGVDVAPIAGALPAELPPLSIQVITLGGPVDSPGVARPTVGVHCRGASEDEAVTVGGLVSAALTLIDSTQIVDPLATIVAVTPQNLPYPNPDPRNANFYRVSQTATLTVKAQRLN